MLVNRNQIPTATQSDDRWECEPSTPLGRLAKQKNGSVARRDCVAWRFSATWEMFCFRTHSLGIRRVSDLSGSVWSRLQNC